MTYGASGVSGPVAAFSDFDTRNAGSRQRTVFLHVGMHKTGTSAIQAALVDYDDGDKAYANFREQNHSLPVCTAFLSSPIDYPTWRMRGLSKSEIMARRAGYRDRLAAELDRNDRNGLIIVGEDIGKIDVRGQTELVQFVLKRGWALRVYCYVRAPESWAASALQQRIKSGLAVIPDRFYPNYRDRINVFLQMLGRNNVCVRLYDKNQLFNGTIVDDFSALIGLRPGLWGGGSHNESLSLDALKLVYALNHSNFCSVGDGALAEARNNFCAEINRLYPGTAKLDPALFVDRVDRRDVPFLRDNFGIDFNARLKRSPNSLEDVLSDMASIDFGPLAQELAAPIGRRDDPIWLINRLFSKHVGMADTLGLELSKISRLLVRSALRRLRRFR